MKKRGYAGQIKKKKKKKSIEYVLTFFPTESPSFQLSLLFKYLGFFTLVQVWN